MPSPVAAAVLVRGLPSMGLGATTQLDAVALDDRLEPAADRVAVTRSALDIWSIQRSPDDPSTDVRLDDGGLPTGPGGADWPLER